MNTYKNIDDLIKDLENFLEDNEYRLTYNGVPNDKVAAISENNCWLIINTITNLQEENEELKKKLDRRYYKNEYERIKEENERLKETIKHYEDTTTFGDYVKEVNLLIDYKSRCEKAIEYIKVGKTFDNEDVRKVVNKIQNDLLNILQNGSDSQ